MGLRAEQQQQQRVSKGSVDLMSDAMAVLQGSGAALPAKPAKRRSSLTSILTTGKKLADKFRRKSSKASSEFLLIKGKAHQKTQQQEDGLKVTNSQVLLATNEVAANNSKPASSPLRSSLALVDGPAKPQARVQTRQAVPVPKPVLEAPAPEAEKQEGPEELPIAYMCASALQVYKCQPFTLLEKLTRYTFDLAIGEPPEDTPSPEARLAAAKAVAAEAKFRPRLPTYEQHQQLASGDATVPL